MLLFVFVPGQSIGGWLRECAHCRHPYEPDRLREGMAPPARHIPNQDR